ncbi:hypothetical protein YC2023_016821 [Brassica napus]
MRGFTQSYKVWYLHGEIGYEYGSTSEPQPVVRLEEPRTEVDYGVGTEQMDNLAPSSYYEVQKLVAGIDLPYQQPRHEVPPNFRSVLSSRLLRRLAAQANFQRLATQNLYQIDQKQQQEHLLQN